LLEKDDDNPQMSQIRADEMEKSESRIDSK